MDTSSIAAQVTQGITNAPTTKATASAAQGADFASLVKGAAENVLDKQKTAESLSIQSIQDPSSVNMQDLISAVSEAELSLQTMVSVRDKTVAAYTKIMDMPI